MKVLGALKAAAAITWLAIILGTSAFTGLMIATAGTAIHTPLFRIAAPVACDGEFRIESRRYSSRPGQTGVSHTVYCRNAATGEQTDITFYAIFIAFLLYSAIVFAALLLLTPVLVILFRLIKRRLKPIDVDFNALSSRITSSAVRTTTAVTPTRIVFNGREYRSADEMPVEARAAYEQAMSVFQDSDRNGVPDLFEGGARVMRTDTNSAAGDAAARLSKLKELRDAGLITEQEYEKKRADILSEL